MPHDVQREAGLSETRTPPDDDQVGWLESSGLAVEVLEAGRDTLTLIVATRGDLVGEPPQRDLEWNDVAVKARLAHREQELLRVGDRALGILTCECEMGDLVRGLDETAQERGALDDRRVRLGVRDRWDVLHETDEELGAADLIELATRRELRLHALETQRLTTLCDPLDRAQDESMLLARQRGRRDASADDVVVDRGVDEDRAEQRCLRLGILRRRFRRAASESVLDRHTGIWSSAALLKNFACSAAKRSEKMPVGPLRFFAMLPWIS
jgi:hypothetical protein